MSSIDTTGPCQNPACEEARKKLISRKHEVKKIANDTITKKNKEIIALKEQLEELSQKKDLEIASLKEQLSVQVVQLQVSAEKVAETAAQLQLATRNPDKQVADMKLQRDRLSEYCSKLRVHDTGYMSEQLSRSENIFRTAEEAHADLQFRMEQRVLHVDALKERFGGSDTVSDLTEYVQSINTHSERFMARELNEAGRRYIYAKQDLAWTNKAIVDYKIYVDKLAKACSVKFLGGQMASPSTNEKEESSQGSSRKSTSEAADVKRPQLQSSKSGASAPVVPAPGISTSAAKESKPLAASLVTSCTIPQPARTLSLTLAHGLSPMNQFPPPGRSGLDWAENAIEEANNKPQDQKPSFPIPFATMAKGGKGKFTNKPWPTVAQDAKIWGKKAHGSSSGRSGSAPIALPTRPKIKQPSRYEAPRSEIGSKLHTTSIAPNSLLFDEPSRIRVSFPPTGPKPASSRRRIATPPSVNADPSTREKISEWIGFSKDTATRDIAAAKQAREAEDARKKAGITVPKPTWSIKETYLKVAPGDDANSRKISPAVESKYVLDMSPNAEKQGTSGLDQLTTLPNSNTPGETGSSIADVVERAESSIATEGEIQHSDEKLKAGVTFYDDEDEMGFDADDYVEHSDTEGMTEEEARDHREALAKIEAMERAEAARAQKKADDNISNSLADRSGRKFGHKGRSASR